MLVFKYSKKKKYSATNKTEKLIMKIRKNYLLFLGVLCAMYYLLSYTVFTEEKIGTKSHRDDALFCYSDDECELYNCTNCGNMYWLKSQDNKICDKILSLIVGCRCEEGKCVRIVKN
jgi:hypothetical protein